MKGKKLRTLLAIAAGLSLASFVFTQCDWTNSCFAGTGNCTSEGCGWTCVIGAYGVEQGKCYSTTTDYCCLCWYRVDECETIFGGSCGITRTVARVAEYGYNCNSSPCGTSCPSVQPPDIPTDG